MRVSSASCWGPNVGGRTAIGCECEVCRSDDLATSDPQLRGPAVHRRDGAPDDLIDTSPDLRQQALREGLTRCDAIVFTHHHVDHVFGLDYVPRFVPSCRPSSISTPGTALENLHRVYPHIFEAEKNINPSFVATLRPHA